MNGKGGKEGKFVGRGAFRSRITSINPMSVSVISVIIPEKLIDSVKTPQKLVNFPKVPPRAQQAGSGGTRFKPLLVEEGEKITRLREMSPRQCIVTSWTSLMPPLFLGENYLWVGACEYYFSNTIRFVNFPIFSISTSTTSPSFKNTGGFMNKPTPPGVPVITSVPRWSVCP